MKEVFFFPTKPERANVKGDDPGRRHNRLIQEASLAPCKSLSKPTQSVSRKISGIESIASTRTSTPTLINSGNLIQMPDKGECHRPDALFHFGESPL